MENSKYPLLYALHSGNLYGTERMALATLDGLRAQFEPIMFAPPGPANEEAQKLGITCEPFNGARDFAARLQPYLSRAPRLAFVATGVMHSLVFVALNLLYRRQAVHLHIVHGGTDERDSYSRKRLLNKTDVVFVAVSNFVRERLLAHGVRADRIRVVENFLPQQRVLSAPRRPSFRTSGIRKVLLVSRVDPIKRIDLLLDVLDRHTTLAELQFRILGTGWDLGELRRRAAEYNPNVVFAGFTNRVPEELAATDLLLHLCPVEPFGLAILEAMVAGVPVLVPSTGGASSLVDDGVSGYHFLADDPDALAARLEMLRWVPSETLNRIVAGAAQVMATRFSECERIDDYRRLIEELA